MRAGNPDHSACDDLIVRMAARQRGVSSDEIELEGYDPKLLWRRANKLRMEGLIFTGSRGRRSNRYFSTKAAADKWANEGVTASAAAAARSRTNGHRLDPSLPVVIPAHVKVQVCPGFRGDRYTPAPGFERVISSDWMLRRQTQAAA